MVSNGPPPARGPRLKQQHNIPGHIWLTDADTGSPILVSLPGVAQAAEAGAHWIPAGMGGWHVTVTETPDQIASLIQQEWYDRISSESIVRAEFGSGNYVLRNPTGGTGR